LLLNGISGLCLQGQALWIAYRNGQNGAVGTLNLKSRKFSTFTANLSPTAGANSQPHYNQVQLDEPHQAPNLPVRSMTEGAPGEMWFAVEEKGLQRFRDPTGVWETIRRVSAYNAYYPAMAADPTSGLLLLAKREHDILSGEKSRSGGLVIYDYCLNQEKTLQLQAGLPSNDLTAVAVAGRIAWVGGRGFVAVVDVQERKTLRFAYISTSVIRQIQLGQKYVWIAVSCDREADSGFSGNAPSGVYRLDRAAIEPAVHVASQK